MNASDIMALSDEEIRERLERAGIVGVTDTELANVRRDATLLRDIEQAGPPRFNMMTMSMPMGKDTRSNEEKFSDLATRRRGYSYRDVSKRSEASRRKNKAQKKARKASRK